MVPTTIVNSGIDDLPARAIQAEKYSHLIYGAARAKPTNRISNRVRITCCRAGKCKGNLQATLRNGKFGQGALDNCVELRGPGAKPRIISR